MKVLLGVTGSVAAYKAVEVASRLRQRGVALITVLTPAACEFVTPLQFEAVSAGPVYTRLFNESPIYPGRSHTPQGCAPAPFGCGDRVPLHVEVADSVDLVCVAPATADFLAKAAHGLADDLLTTTILALDAPILVAPTMNDVMWTRPAVERNLAQLRSDGVEFIPPGEGHLACGRIGPGRMAEPAEIVEAVMARLARKPKA